ncbi:hypothetical protein FA13DRAFT_1187280 [Coprinellus micaceus]|uniref:Uncharacterized protein n=1 Tax=Coprinellus micaceus TaxID=71717 RepID=A0A4Y7STE4_COPMI|nr:hypothetical protein FA13DRAFT_1187280 [Coprinellus micaceus]
MELVVAQDESRGKAELPCVWSVTSGPFRKSSPSRCMAFAWSDESVTRTRKHGGSPPSHHDSTIIQSRAAMAGTPRALASSRYFLFSNVLVRRYGQNLDGEGKYNQSPMTLNEGGRTRSRGYVLNSGEPPLTYGMSAWFVPIKSRNDIRPLECEATPRGTE